MTQWWLLDLSSVTLLNACPLFLAGYLFDLGVVCFRYINELIESLVIASTEKERQGSEKASGPTQQRVSDPTSQKRTSVSGHETIGLSRLPRSPKQVVSEINPLKKKKKHVKAIGDVEGSTQSQPPYAIKPVKEVACMHAGYVDGPFDVWVQFCEMICYTIMLSRTYANNVGEVKLTNSGMHVKNQPGKRN